MFNSLGNLADLMKNAGRIQESVKTATEALGRVEVEATTGGVRVRANGRLEILSVEIGADLFNAAEPEALGEAVTEAVNAALLKSREAAARSLSSLAGGLPIPGLAGLLGSGPGGA